VSVKRQKKRKSGNRQNVTMNGVNMRDVAKQVSISPTFYSQLFHTKVLCTAFL
jgi:hypothetical protein